MSLLRSGYYGIAWAGAPFISVYLQWRAKNNREEKARLSERKGITALPRPNRSLLWVNAVSVGEAIAALTIIQSILKKHPEIQVLLTTTTTSSAHVVQKRLPKNVIHQFCPVDTPQAVKRFLEHWQPDLAIWIESELWPNLMHQTQERGIPTILLNGRMSEKSFANWKWFKGVISPLLSRLVCCGVQSEKQATFFKTLGAQNVFEMNNVKLMMDPLKVDLDKFDALKKEIGTRPLWLAASTHPGEEEIVFQTHKVLQKSAPNLLTILVPRHIERAQALKDLAQKESLSSVLRSQGKLHPKIDVYIVDTLGEMGLFYALSPIVLMGATFTQLGTFIIHGPHTFKNPQLYETLRSLNFSNLIHESSDIALFVKPWLKKKKESYEEPAILKIYREEGLKNLMALLSPHLKALKREQE